jgi:hypothetical protein
VSVCGVSVVLGRAAVPTADPHVVADDDVDGEQFQRS